MHEVSAVVLSVGEPFTQRAIDSLATQSVPLRDVIVIEHMSPFFRAINEGARRVRTPFFVQVDADMVLDPTCVEVLCRHMRDDVGIAVAELRDPLFGQTVGIKLFRTACFGDVPMGDSIAQDTDFVAALQRAGWRTVYVEQPGGDSAKPRPTLGEHRPDYTPSYTYRKMQLEGARLRHRASAHGLFWRMGTLEPSEHPLATLAQLALGRGVFLGLERDELKPPAHDPRADALMAFLSSAGRADDVAEGLLPLTRHGRLRDLFRCFVEAGGALGQADAGATFRDTFAALSGARRDARALVAKMALAQGLLASDEDRARRLRNERLCRDFVIFSLGSRATPSDRLRARARHLLRPRWEGLTAPW
jgi:hypothetical protein